MLGREGIPGDYWAPADQAKNAEQQERLRWYRYLFLGRSKPSTHLRALTRLETSELRNGPEPVCALIDWIKSELEL